MRYGRLPWSALILTAALCAACGGSPTQPTPVGTGREIPPIGSSAPTAPSRPLTKTSFVAFGDSITAGTITMFNGLLRLVVAPQSYPYKLQAILTGEHGGQRIQVYNEGVQGECAGSDGMGCDDIGSVGTSRLPGVLRADSPQVVLLLQGIDDLNPPNNADIPTVIGHLQQMIGEAQGAGATVLIGTLLPQVRGGSRAWSIDLIQPFNAQLKVMAASAGATVVDLYTPFAADLSLIGPDGLHPTAAGYTEMAQVWANAIDAAFSIPLPKATSNSPEPLVHRP